MVIFDVNTTGSTKILTKVMNNLVLRKLVDEITVYGCKGQTVREALEQNGRFSDDYKSIILCRTQRMVNVRKCPPMQIFLMVDISR